MTELDVLVGTSEATVKAISLAMIGELNETTNIDLVMKMLIR